MSKKSPNVARFRFQLMAKIMVFALQHPVIAKLAVAAYQRLPAKKFSEYELQQMRNYRREYEDTVAGLSGIKRQSFIAHHDRFALRQHIAHAQTLRRYTDYRYI